MSNYDDDINKIEYGKKFTKDPAFEKVLSDTSIDSKVTMSKIHKSINSLSGELEKSKKSTLNQFKGLSSSISSTSNQQKKLVQQIRMKELASSKQVKITEKSVQQILGKLGYTINVLGTTSKKVLLDTAKTTKETLREYTQAISADFAVNKTNFLSMTLAKASPIFGYFAGKFMETSVFKNFANLIKNKLGLAVTFVSNKMKDIWGRIKSRRKKKDEGLEANGLPKLQSGGYIKKTGAVQVHAAEVVTPLNKLSSAFSKALEPLNQKISQIFLVMSKFSNSLTIKFKQALIPLNMKMTKIVDYIKWYSITSMATSGYKIFKMWQRNKYSSRLSKDKDPKRKLTEDFSNYYVLSLEKLDNIYNALTNKKTKRIKNKKKNKETNKNIKKISDNLKEDTKIQREDSKLLKKIKNATEGSEEKISSLNSGLKKSASRLTGWLMIALGFFKSMFSSVTGMFKKFGTMLGGSSLGKLITGGWGRGKGKGGMLKKAKLGKFAKYGKFLKMGGGVLSALSMGLDAWEGVGKSEEWGSSKTSSGIGAALGGTDGGGKGALLGMAKGAAVGMMLGPIGAGIGALAGGLLGLVGGKNISKGLDWMWEKIQPLVKSITDVIMFPFKILMKLKDRFMEWFNDPTKTMFDRIGDIAKVVSNIITFPGRLMIGLMSSLGKSIWNMIPNIVKKIMPDFIVKGVDAIFATADKASKGFESSFGGGSAVENTTSAVKTVAQLPLNVIKGGAQSAYNVASAPVKYAGEKVSQAGTAIKEKVMSTNVGKKAASGVSYVAKKTKQAASAVGTEFKTEAKKASEMARAGYQKTKQFVGKIGESVRERYYGVKSALLEASKRTGVDYNLLTQIAGVESGYNPSVKAKTSSATGLFQFIRSTWDNMIAKKGKKYGIAPGTPPTDPVANAIMGAEYAKENMGYMKRSNYNATDVYISHFLGTGGGRKFLNALDKNPSELGINVVTPSQAKANQPIFMPNGRPASVGEIYQSFTNKLSKFSVANLEKTGSEKLQQVSQNVQSITGSAGKNISDAANTSNNLPLKSQVSSPSSSDWMLAKGEKSISDTPAKPISSSDWMLAKGEKSISDSDDKRPLLTKNDVAKFEATKEMISSNLNNIDSDKLKDSALEMLNKANQNSIVMINNFSNTISKSLSNMSNSISGGGQGSGGQFIEELQKLLTADV